MGDRQLCLPESCHEGRGTPLETPAKRAHTSLTYRKPQRREVARGKGTWRGQAARAQRPAERMALTAWKRDPLPADHPH